MVQDMHRGSYLQAMAHRTYETTAQRLAQKQTAILQEELRGSADRWDLGWATLNDVGEIEATCWVCEM